MNNNFGFPPLDQVQQDWIRIPVTIFYTLILFIIGIPYHILAGWSDTIKYFFIPCFIGPKK